MDDHDDRVETATQLIHEHRHPRGRSQTCSACRELAKQIDALYAAKPAG